MKRQLLTLPLLLAVLETDCVSAPEATSISGRPNILFIFSDDQSYKTVSCHPEALPGARTPHIDALAKSGVRFSHAYMGAWCMPSRATLLTGRHPHGIESMRMTGRYPASEYDPEECPFWPAVFRAQGYQTAHIGKWHTGTDAGFGRDWDHQIVWNRPKHPDNAGSYYDDQLLSFDGGEARVEKGYSTDKYTDWACDYIRGEQRQAGKPWYLWLCYGAVHGPTTPARRHLGTHQNDEVRVPADIVGPRPGKPDYLKATQSWIRTADGRIVAGKEGGKAGKQGRNAGTYEDYIHQVLECVSALDEGVGRVMTALKDSGQLENTLVVFTADQGFAMGEHGLRTKLAPYDASYRSPLIISWPGTFPENKVCARPVNGTDLVATFSAAAGIPIPWEIHGRDLTPLLHDPEGASWDHPCFFEGTGDHFGSNVTRVVKEEPEKAEHHHFPWYAAINDGRFKYVRYLKPGLPEELYDLQKDPEELTNLAADAAHQADLLRLREAVVGELRRTKAGYSDSLPEIVPLR
jgi:arylsulfatase A-like enzyme